MKKIMIGKLESLNQILPSNISPSFIITMMKEVVEDSKLSKSPEYKEEMIRVKVERKLKAEEEEIQAEARWKDKERRINDGTYVWGSDAEFEQSLKENL